jgi:hypothetical protein
MLRSGQRLVFSEWHFGTEQKVGKGALVQNTADDDGAIFDLEIETVFLCTEPIHHMAIPLDFSKPIAPCAVQILLGHMEFLQQLKLLQSPQSGNFRRTDFIKNNLKHAATLVNARAASTFGIPDDPAHAGTRAFFNINE